MADYSAEQICLRIKEFDIKLFSIVIFFLFSVKNLHSLQVILYSFHLSFPYHKIYHARGFLIFIQTLLDRSHYSNIKCWQNALFIASGQFCDVRIYVLV
jgi:hypothetical protein